MNNNEVANNLKVITESVAEIADKLSLLYQHTANQLPGIRFSDQSRFQEAASRLDRLAEELRQFHNTN